MKPQDLKNSILQLAIQGKLVEQRPEEGTGEDLYQLIQVEKKPLIKSGTIKKESLLPEISEDEKPFDIPDSWVFARLDDIVQKNIKRGKSPTYIEKSDTLVFAQKCNVKTGGINMALAQFLDEATLRKYPEDEFMRHLDIVVNSTGNGTLGRVGIFRESDNSTCQRIVPDSHVTVIRVSKLLIPEYVHYCLKSNQHFFESMGDGSTNQTELKPYILRTLLIPLPPLAEQKRIVAKIEELLPYIDRYDQAWSKLEDFNKRFPTDMQKSILQMAFQGKLVEQRPEEGTAKDLIPHCRDDKARSIREGKYKKESFYGAITDNDSIPFETPESWIWMFISDMSLFQEGPGIMAIDFRDVGVPLIRIAGMQTDNVTLDGCNYLDEDQVKLKWSHFRLDLGDIVISTSASMDKIAEVNEDCVGSIPYTGLIRFKMYGGIDKNYFKWFVKSQCYLKQVDEQKAGGTIKHYGPSHLRKMVIPIPPLSEQKRIVSKLNEILPLCEKLK